MMSKITSVEITDLRAVALYRVSSTQQSGEDNDLTSQRKIVQDFIFNNNFNLVREFTECGVSAFKNKILDRKAIISIINMAQNKEFNILVIYHSNRLGRRAEETTKLIKLLETYNVKVISTLEGELKIQQSADNLLNTKDFINEYESELKSEVISDYHIAMVKQGKFRGGSMIPFGYKLVDLGSKNFKGRPILDFMIDEQEAEIIRLIFSLSVDMNYGQSRIAKYLNEKETKTKKDGVWHASSIQNILNNTMYKGVFRYNSKIKETTIYSPVREDLVIISPELWEENQQKMKSRRFEKKDYQSTDKRTSKNIYGKMLLNGLAVCGHCGMSLTTMTVYKRWTTKDGAKHKVGTYKYRCASFYKKGGIKCDGQSTYGVTKIEPFVIEETQRLILELQGKQLKAEFLESLDRNIEILQSHKSNISSDLEKAYQKLKVLKDEFIKILIGESNSNKEFVNEFIYNTEKEINYLRKAVETTEQEILITKSDKESFLSFGNEITNWEKTFNDSDLEIRRMMLSKVFDRVVVYRDKIILDFNPKFKMFSENSTYIL